MKAFNTTAVCIPKLHYMVDLSARLQEVRKMVKEGKYFTVNRARQYGKTTMLKALAKDLAGEYEVISLDFQGMDSDAFSSVGKFSQAFGRMILDEAEFGSVKIPEIFADALEDLNRSAAENVNMDDLFRIMMRWCRVSEKPVVLIIDEVDSASDNQVFLDFLAQLRRGYIRRDTLPVFHSVILAGVTDIKNLKRKLQDGKEHKSNSPWNIAADFNVEMSFSPKDIAGMLQDYEKDHQTGMNVNKISRTIYDYTGGYPFLVSRICQLTDEEVSQCSRFGTLQSAWTDEGISEAVRRILMEKNTLFESLMGKLEDGELSGILYRILFEGESIVYNADNAAVGDAQMYGFIRNDNGSVRIANRIFETRLYNYFLSIQEIQRNEVSRIVSREKKLVEAVV